MSSLGPGPGYIQMNSKSLNLKVYHKLLRDLDPGFFFRTKESNDILSSYIVECSHELDILDGLLFLDELRHVRMMLILQIWTMKTQNMWVEEIVVLLWVIIDDHLSDFRKYIQHPSAKHQFCKQGWIVFRILPHNS